MVKRHKTILLLIVTLLFGFNLKQGLANAQEQEVTIKALKERPEAYVEKTIKLRAKLTAVREKPWQFPHVFVLEDEKGNQFPVTVWAPLEVPPPAPGTEEHWRKNRPHLMSDFLDKWLLIKGKVKNKGNKIMPSIKGEYYIEVKWGLDPDHPDVEIIKVK